MKITVYNGDGIGPEITKCVTEILDSLEIGLEYEYFDLGKTAFDKCGELLPASSIASLKENRIALKAPCTTPIGSGFRSVNVALRKQLDLYANIRPCKSVEGVKSRYENVDLIVFRENTEGLYIGEEVKESEDSIIAIKRITRKGSTRIIKAAFEYAKSHGRHKVTCVHKANILKMADGLFLDIFNEIKKDYPEIEANDLIVDNTCMQLVMDPSKFDIIVTMNLYGDILSDLSSGLIGGLGLLPSCNTNGEYSVYEAVHGSAPDIANKNIANPTALLYSACMMLEDNGYQKEAILIKTAVETVLNKGLVRTADLGGVSTTTEYTAEIIKYIKENK